MDKTILLLGHTGKMGTALAREFRDDYNIVGKNSRDFNALDAKAVRTLVVDVQPDVVMNTVAFLGIDPCEEDWERAFALNTLYPRQLAELSIAMNFRLIHFSTDAVFDNRKQGFFTESDCPRPLNLYGLSKFGGDCFVQNISRDYFLIRIPVLFGETVKENQFVEKMLARIARGDQNLRISGDIISSPTYSKDVAGRVRNLVEQGKPSGLYHVANEGRASLFDLMAAITESLKLDVRLEKGSYRDFPFIGVKNTFTPMSSEKLKPLRPWQEAVTAYCCRLKT